MLAYDYNGALTMASQWLNDQARARFGDNYALVRTISATLNKEQTLNDAQSLASADITTTGTWKHR